MIVCQRYSKLYWHIRRQCANNSEKRLALKKVCARWVPHFLTEEQKTQRLKCARELLKTFKGCNSRVISNYAIFFNSSGPIVQVSCSSGHTVTGRFYKNSVLKKVKEFYTKKRPSKGWSVSPPFT